jgi:hypothetical protein
MMTTTTDRADPRRLMQMSWSFAAPLLVEAGVRIGLFDLLEGEPRTIEQTAAATGTSARGLAALMFALAGLQLLFRDEAGRFCLTRESAAFLVSSKPEANLSGIFSHVSTQLIPAWLDLVEAVRTGRPATGRSNLPEEGAFFANFAESLLPLGWPAASALAEHLRIEEAEGEPSVLDIGAGSGVYSIPFALRSPRVRITAVDLPEVLKVTRRIAERYGVGNRLTAVAGNMVGGKVIRRRQTPDLMQSRFAVGRVNPSANRVGDDEAQQHDDEHLAKEALGRKPAHSTLTVAVSM